MTVLPVWPIWYAYGTQPASTAARVAPTAAPPIAAARSSSIENASGPPRPRPPAITTGAVSSEGPACVSSWRATHRGVAEPRREFRRDALDLGGASARRRRLDRARLHRARSAASGLRARRRRSACRRGSRCAPGRARARPVALPISDVPVIAWSRAGHVAALVGRREQDQVGRVHRARARRARRPARAARPRSCRRRWRRAGPLRAHRRSSAEAPAPAPNATTRERVGDRRAPPSAARAWRPTGRRPRARPPPRRSSSQITFASARRSAIRAIASSPASTISPPGLLGRRRNLGHRLQRRHVAACQAEVGEREPFERLRLRLHDALHARVPRLGGARRQRDERRQGARRPRRSRPRSGVRRGSRRRRGRPGART